MIESPDTGSLLKTATRARHQATEALLLGDHLTLRSLSRERYARLIAVTQQVWLQRSSAAGLLNGHPAFGLATNQLLLALKKDCHLLGLATPVILPIDYLSEAQALGALYVLFGSTLGGRVIHRFLPECPELAQLPAFHFYKACSDLPGVLWPELRQLLNQRVTTETEKQNCLQSANATFDQYHYYYGLEDSEGGGGGLIA